MTAAPAPVLLLWGESDFLVHEAARASFGDARPTEIDAVEWRPGALADLATPSLLAEARGLLVTGAERLPEEALSEVAAYAADPDPDARLVLAAVVGPRARGPAKRLSQAAGPSAKVHRVAVERRDLPAWVRERARRHGIAATPAGASALVATVGEDPGVLEQAVAQVAAAHPAEGLTPDTVAAQFRGFGDRRVWEVCDAAFGGDLRAAVRALAGMLEAREEPLAILGGIAARLRELIRVAAFPPGTPLPEVARGAGLRFDWQARRFRDQAGRFPGDELVSLHAAVAEADQLLKLGGAGDVVLARLVSRIAAGGPRAAQPVR
ncbi:MAG TPA: hypothetical protein VHL78_00615 [Actinomycetota bacterium]|nr:hypothetical protein [Actinomycetota bacterium]